jgi:YQGE family putative transporter
LADIAYFTIQLLVIDTVSAIEKRNQYSYICVQECGFYLGRFAGCGLFILLATQVSNTFALRYALLIVAVLQLLSVVVAKVILKGCARHAPGDGAAESPPSVKDVMAAPVAFSDVS